MDILKDYKANILEISDTDISANWRLGLLRACGIVAASSMKIDEATGRFGAHLVGSMNEHLFGPDFSYDKGVCTIEGVYDLTEDAGTHYNFSTFGGTESDVMLLKGKVSCACGEIVRAAATYEVSLGEFISLVMNVE